MKQQAIGADGLVAVMLQGNRLARQPREKEREQNGTREMDHVRVANQASKRKHAGVSHYGKGQRGVVEISRTGFRSYREIKQRPIVHGAKLREASRQGHRDGLNAANFRCERMRVQEQLHSETVWRRCEWNLDLYDKDISPKDIVLKGAAATPPSAKELLSTLNGKTPKAKAGD